MKHYIITISRQFASMGRSTAKQLATQLGINFYDRDIVEKTADRMGMRVSHISDAEETTPYLRRMFPLGSGLKSEQDEIFMTQQNIIRDLAEKESCIIVGRCAEFILADYENVLNVYIYAPYDARLKNCTEKLGMDEKTAKKMIAAVDRSRTQYHKYYGGGAVDGVFTNRHLMLDSSHFGIDGTANIIEQVAKTLFSDATE